MDDGGERKRDENNSARTPGLPKPPTAAAKPSAAGIPKVGGVALWASASPSGDNLLVGYGDECDKPGEFLLWALAKQKGSLQIGLKQKAPLSGLKELRSLLISPDGTLIFAATPSETYVWGKQKGKTFSSESPVDAQTPRFRLTEATGLEG